MWSQQYTVFPGMIFSPTLSRLLVNFLTFPWQLSNAPTFPGNARFSDKWSSWKHYMVHIKCKNSYYKNRDSAHRQLINHLSYDYYTLTTQCHLPRKSHNVRTKIISSVNSDVNKATRYLDGKTKAKDLRALQSQGQTFWPYSQGKGLT